MPFVSWLLNQSETFKMPVQLLSDPNVAPGLQVIKMTPKVYRINYTNINLLFHEKYLTLSSNGSFLRSESAKQEKLKELSPKLKPKLFCTCCLLQATKFLLQESLNVRQSSHDNFIYNNNILQLLSNCCLYYSCNGCSMEMCVPNFVIYHIFGS